MCNNPNLELNFFESKNESVVKRLLNTTEFVDDKLERLYKDGDKAYMWVPGLENRAFGGFIRLIGSDLESASYKAFILPKVNKLSLTRHDKRPEIVSDRTINDLEIEGNNDELTIYSKNAEGNVEKIVYKLCADNIKESRDELPDPSDEITECDVPSNENNNSNENNKSESLYDKLKGALSSLTDKQPETAVPVSNINNEITLNDQQLEENNLVRKDEFDNVKREHTELQDKQTQLENDHTKLREEYDELRREYSELKLDHDSLRTENAELKDEHTNILAKLEKEPEELEPEVLPVEEVVPEEIELDEEPTEPPVEPELPIEAPIESQAPLVEEPIESAPSEPNEDRVENVPRTPEVPVEPIRAPEPVVAEPAVVPTAPAPPTIPIVNQAPLQETPENTGEQTEFDIESRIYGLPPQQVGMEQPQNISQPPVNEFQPTYQQPPTQPATEATLAGGNGSSQEQEIERTFSVGRRVILTGGGRKRSRRLLRRASLKKKSRRNRKRR